MKSMKNCAGVFLAIACASCGTAPDQTTSAQPREEKVYRTGSSIPVRDPNAISDVKTVDPATMGGQISGSRPPAGVAGK